MSNMQIKKYLEKTALLDKYQIRVESKPFGLIYDYKVDEKNQKLQMTAGFENRATQFAEMFRDKGGAFAKLVDSKIAYKINTSQAFPNYLKDTVSILVQKSKLKKIIESRDSWIAEVLIETNALFEGRDELIGRSLALAGISEQSLKTTVGEYIKGITATASVKVLKRTLMLDSITFKVNCQGKVFENNVKLLSENAEITGFNKTEVSEDKKVTNFHDLLAYSHTIGGWMEKDHQYWAQLSLDLIESLEAALPVHQRKYAELYYEGWHAAKFELNEGKHNSEDIEKEQKYHPIVTGAYWEDQDHCPEFFNDWFKEDPDFKRNKKYFYDSIRRTRDYNHFGGEETGLEHELYFSVRDKYEGKEVTNPPVGNRYYSAKNWGWNDKQNNKMTFQGAIKQYNRNTADGKKLAYLMLGYVLHLMQDSGNPDHAGLSAHPSSGKNEKEAYDVFYVAEFAAAEAALIFGWPLGIAVAAAVYLAVRASINENEVGYERLIGDSWDTKRTEAAVSAMGIIKKNSYDEFFRDLSRMAVSEANKRNLTSPLGLGNLLYFPVIPGCDPNIDKSNKKEIMPYYEMTDTLVSNIICHGAGFITYFYETVNPPPYLKSVRIFNAASGLTQLGFGVLKESYYNNEVYHAEWNDVINPVTQRYETRILDEKIKNKISQNGSVYVFLKFGPSISPIKSKSIKEDSLKVMLKGTAPNGESINIIVNMLMAEDAGHEYYYWGSFNPSLGYTQDVELTLCVEARDASAHLATRTNRGDMLDKDPSNIAIANWDNPTAELLNYSPGVDTNHKIILNKAVTADRYEENNSFQRATEIDLRTSYSQLLELSLHNEQDVDFFKIYYPQIEEKYNSNLTLKNKYFSVTGNNAYLGIFASHWDNPLDIAIYKSDRTCVTRIKSVCPISFSLPTSIFNDRQLYVEIRNSNGFKTDYNLSVSFNKPSYSTHSGAGLKEVGIELPWEILVHANPADLVTHIDSVLNNSIIKMNNNRIIQAKLLDVKAEIGIYAKNIGELALSEKVISSVISEMKRLDIKEQQVSSIGIIKDIVNNKKIKPNKKVSKRPSRAIVK